MKQNAKKYTKRLPKNQPHLILKMKGASIIQLQKSFEKSLKIR